MGESAPGTEAPKQILPVSQALFECLMRAKNQYYHLHSINNRMTEFLDGAKEDCVVKGSTETDLHGGSGVILIQKELDKVIEDIEKELNIFEESIFSKL